jgi:hypothetical protein
MMHQLVAHCYERNSFTAPGISSAATLCGIQEHNNWLRIG